jgi:general secretion pathway protein L
MTVLRQITEGFLWWIDRVAETVVAILGWIVSPRVVQLIEGDSGKFAVRGKGQNSLNELQITDNGTHSSADEPLSLKGSRTEICLRPSRFVFRQIELPRRAGEFLDGIIREQIDRLTPWSASDAVFGWSKPTDIAGDRIALTVAATARAQVMPFVRVAAGLGAESIALSTTLDTPEASAPIKVLDQKTQSALDVHRVRRLLIAVLLIGILAAGASISAAIAVAGNLEARQSDLSRRIAERRAVLRAGLDAAGNTALAKLERRKHESPAAVIVLEALSQILPDHTYVTELRVEGDKMQAAGMTLDAPSLIRLIEQSPHFTRATFFAPTTRLPSESSDRFHIEALIKPVFAVRP